MKELQHIPLKRLVAELEEQLINQAMEETSNNQSLAARLLGISRGKLIYRLREFRVNNLDPNGN